MAITNNLIMEGATGAIDKQIVLRRVGNKTIISAYPDMSNRKLSAKQKQMNQLMKEANDAAKQIIANDEQRNAAQVRLNVARNRLYTALIKEYFQTVRQQSK
jgi:hypothetical protein